MSKFEELIYSLMSFVFGIIGGVIEFVVAVSLVFLACYVFCRYFVCDNDKDQWNKFSVDIKSGIKDVAEAFKISGPAIKETARRWVEDVIDSI